MKLIYESFTEIAKDFTDGNSITHVLSDHEQKDCFAWQHGVHEFAKWLDSEGLKIISNPDVYSKLWENTRMFKPEKFEECSKK
jgi:hypothetical protein